MDSDPLPSLINLLLTIQQPSTATFLFHAPVIGWGPWILIIIIAFTCLLMSAFISGSEMAYFGLSQSQTDQLADDEDDRKSQRAYKLLENSEQLLATILIGNNLVNITMVVLLTFAINQTVTFNSELLNFLVQTILLTFLLLLFGEIFPKLVARGRSVSWVKTSSKAMSVIYRILSPLAKIMVKSGSFVTKIVAKKQNNISTQQLEKALEISDLQEGQDKEMLEGILTFGEKEAGDVMISRVDVTAIEYHDTWEKAMEIILDSAYSRIPVYDTSQDSIRGILYSKDLLPYIERRPQNFKWQSLIRKAYFVPESRNIDDLLEDFRTKKIHIAIVVDEYGGTQGIVTLEDVIEEIVGEIDDEYDESRSLYKQIAPDTYIFDAKISISDFCHALDIEEEALGDIGEAETLAGLMLQIKGDFPTLTETLERGALQLKALKIERRRITKVKVKLNA